MKFQLFFMDEVLVFVMIECSVTSCMGVVLNVHLYVSVGVWECVPLALYVVTYCILHRRIIAKSHKMSTVLYNNTTLW